MPASIVALALCVSPVVHDGDTIRCGAERVRIMDIDAPELPGSSRCDPRHLRGGANPSWCDFDKGYASRDALASFIAHNQVMLERHGTDRYGRTLAKVSVNGQDAGAYLVSIGLARWWQ